MRLFLILLLILITAAGAVAGVFAGKALAGNAQLPSGTPSSGVRALGSPDDSRRAPAPISSSNTIGVQRQAPLFSQPLPGSNASTSPNQVVPQFFEGLLSRETLERPSGTGQPLSFSQLPPRSRVASSPTQAVPELRGVTASRETLESPLGRRARAIHLGPGDARFSPRLLPSLTSIGGSSSFVQVSRGVASGMTVFIVPLGDVNLDRVVDVADLLILALVLRTGPTGELIVVDWNGDGDVDVADPATPLLLVEISVGRRP